MGLSLVGTIPGSATHNNFKNSVTLIHFLIYHGYEHDCFDLSKILEIIFKLSSLSDIMITNISISATISAQQLVIFSPGNYANLKFFFNSAIVAYKASYESNITVTTVTTNNSVPEYLSMVGVITLDRTSLNRVLLI